MTHLERDLELNSLEYPDETQMNTVTHKQQSEGNQDNAGNINSDTNDSNNYKFDRKSGTVYPIARHVAKRTTPQRDFILEPMQ